MAKHPKNVVEYRVYDLPLDFPVILLDGEEWRLSDILSNRLHFHNCFEIGVCHTDSGIMLFEDRRVPFRAGDISCIPRHIPHTTCSDKGTRSLWSYLFFDMEQLLGLDPASPHAGKAALPDAHWLINRDQHPRVHFLVTCVLEEMRAKKPDCTAVVRDLLMVLYHELMRLQNDAHSASDEKPRGAFVLKPALEHIAHNYMNPITADELAEMCKLSTTHFRRLFVSVVGDSPISFINATRINQACALLLTTEDSILSIAGAVGFASISSFNRCFTQIMDISPREYRNPSIRDKIQPRRKHVVRHMGWMQAELRPESVAEEQNGNGGAPAAQWEEQL